MFSWFFCCQQQLLCLIFSRNFPQFQSCETTLTHAQEERELKINLLFLPRTYEFPFALSYRLSPEKMDFLKDRDSMSQTEWLRKAEPDRGGWRGHEWNNSVPIFPKTRKEFLWEKEEHKKVQIIEQVCLGHSLQYIYSFSLQMNCNL